MPASVPASMTVRPWQTPLMVLGAAAVVLALNMGLRQTYGLFLDPISESLAVGLGTLSFAIAIQNLLWGVLTPVAGAAADRWGAGRVLALGGLLYTAGLATMALVQTPLGFQLGAGLLTGMAVSASGFPLVLSVVARVAPEEKRSAWLGLAAAGGSVGQFVLLPGAQQLIGNFGWATALLVLAAFALLVVVLSPVLSGKPPAEAAGAPKQSLRQAIAEAGGHRGFQLLTAGFFVCGFHVAFIATHLPGYVVACNLTAFVGATALGVIGFFNIIGGLMAGWLGGIYRKKRLLAGIYFARAVVITIFMLGPKTELAVYMFAGAFGFLWLSTVPLTSGLVGQIFGPRYMATLFGFVMLSHQIGGFFGAWLGGLSFDLTQSYDAVWMLAIALGLLAAALHWPIADKPVERLSMSPNSSPSPAPAQ